MATLTFLGAARTVTGSKYLLEVDGRHILVDCGQFQGLKELRQRNWAAFPIHPSSLDAVLLTHAHIDHSGLLPRLVANGFHGRIFCTSGTAALCSLVLPDAGRLQEEDARFANRKRFSRHTPALPLFTEADAQATLKHLEIVRYDTPVEFVPGFIAEYTNAGHLLGSAFVRVSRATGGSRVLFGGDLGRYGRPVLPDPMPAPDAETLLLESTYGDRVHPDADDATALEQLIEETTARGGRVIIPAFAVGRAEEVLYWIKRLEDAGRLTPLPVYLDSPMAVEALAFYARHETELDADVRAGTGEVSAFSPQRFRAISSARDSREITASHGAAIVICRQRHGDRRPRAASSGGVPAGPAQHACSLSGSRRRARAGARSWTARRRSRYTESSCRSPRGLRGWTVCRRTPIRPRSYDGWGRSGDRPSAPSSCTESLWRRTR